jgi:hypothetical protein
MDAVCAFDEDLGEGHELQLSTWADRGRRLELTTRFARPGLGERQEKASPRGGARGASLAPGNDRAPEAGEEVKALHLLACGVVVALNNHDCSLAGV